MFEFDEYTVKNKSIQVEITRIQNREEEWDNIKFVPAKYCPFRYAQHGTAGGNVQLKIKQKKGRKMEMKDLHKAYVMEVTVVKKISPGQPIVIHIGN